MDYVFKPSAVKDLKKLPKIIQKRVVAKLEFYSSTQNPLAFAERFKDHVFGDYRSRIGDYRILFDLEGNTIVILACGHRRHIYR